MSRPLTDEQCDSLYLLLHEFMHQSLGDCWPFILLVFPRVGEDGVPEGDTVEVIPHSIPDELVDAALMRVAGIPETGEEQVQ